MLDIEKYMESFKESISKRFEKQEENFRNLAGKMKRFEVTQIENKKRLKDGRNLNKIEDRQQVKNFIFIIFLIIQFFSIDIII